MKKITTPSDPAHHIAVFQETTIRRVWHNEEWWFAIVDVVSVLTDSADPRQYIKKMRSRDPELDANWGTTCTPLALQAADGKQRATNCANTEGLDVVKTGNKLRDHMTDLELIFTMLGEASTTEIARRSDALGFDENRTSAKEGGKIAGNARKALEAKTGKKVVSKANYLATAPSPGLLDATQPAPPRKPRVRVKSNLRKGA